jgi:hypothetical protein
VGAGATVSAVFVHHRLAPAPTVRHAEVDGLRVVLDLDTETYRILDDAATVMWRVLTGEADATSTFDALAREYDVDAERFGADLTAFAQRCISERLLEAADAPAQLRSAAPPHARVRSARPGMIAALTCLIATRRALARDGFKTTYERYGELPVAGHARPLDAVLPAFARAENFFVARRAPEDCLLRSLSLYRFLRSGGVPAEHVIGVRRFPFAAHAWVECGGTPVRDERARDFTPLARIRSDVPNS